MVSCYDKLNTISRLEACPIEVLYTIYPVSFHHARHDSVEHLQRSLLGSWASIQSLGYFSNKVVVELMF